MSSELEKMSNDPMWLYRSLFRKIIANDLPLRVGNDSDRHAIVLISELIAAAKNSVDIYCKSLSSAIWGSDSVLSAVREAVANGVSFRIVTQEAPEDSTTLRVLQAHQQASFLRYSREGLVSNFMIVDRKMFRVEPDNRVRQGFAYVNNKAIADDLCASFDRIIVNATQGSGLNAVA